MMNHFLTLEGRFEYDGKKECDNALLLLKKMKSDGCVVENYIRTLVTNKRVSIEDVIIEQKALESPLDHPL